jgi:O-antigen biosynthesis protein
MDSEFNEIVYLQINPDVAEAVRNKVFASGYEHYVKLGREQDRPTSFAMLIERSQQKVLERERQIDDLKLALLERERQVAGLNQTVDAMRRSTSWRLSAPVRWFGSAARGLTGGSALWRTAAAGRAVVWRLLRNESLPSLIKRALKIWRREGWRGITARARHQHYMASAQLGAQTPAASGFAVTPASLTRDQQGKYALDAVARGYTYVAPQKPADLAQRLAAITCQPRFSIVVPVYNTAPDLLAAVLSSVQAQWYPHWELILADDASPSEETRAALAAIDHPQIKLLRLEKNQGIAGATNAGLAAAQGDFIVFMDHDDELTVDCLYELALCIEREQPDFVYSDEDKLDEQGNYVQPHFKPDWSPDTMMSTMFTCHVSCVRRSLLEQVGGLRSQYDGCQDWDFVLRVAEHTSRISHVPKVLYHWRIIPASVASDIGAKPYVLEASRRVRADALERRGLAGSVEPVSQVRGYFRVNYHLRGTPLVSIIIPSRDNGAVLARCVDSIHQKSSYRNFEIIVLDNGSVQPDTLAYLEQAAQVGQIRVIRHDAPFNFSELNNIGAAQARGELLLFLNDDTEVLVADWLERLGGYAQLPHIGAVGAKLLYPGGQQIQHAGVLNLANGPVHAFLRHASELPGYFMRNLLEYNWLAVTGACLMMERSKFDAMGQFDESFPVAYNDVELCFRSAEHGYYNILVPAVTLIHHESVSRGLDHVDPAKLARLMKDLRHLYEIHPRYFQHDPFHNPNLHPSGLNFEVPC